MKIGEIKRMCGKVKSASRELALVPAELKDRAIVAMAQALVKNSGYIIRQNDKDIAAARKRKMSGSLIDRLALNGSRIIAMADSLFQIAKLKDPIGSVIETRKRPNGLLIKKVRVPIGVVLIIYESRPNVTSDCAGLCLKSSNAVILRGGSETINSNRTLVKIIQAAVKNAGVPGGAVQFVDSTDRSLVNQMLKMGGVIDLIIPRGGASLIKFVAENACMPVVTGGIGVCHTYIDSTADIS